MRLRTKTEGLDALGEGGDTGLARQVMDTVPGEYYPCRPKAVRGGNVAIRLGGGSRASFWGPSGYLIWSPLLLLAKRWK